MKLRNKTTGKIVNFRSIIIDFGDDVTVLHSITELNEVWEDYIPPKTIIKNKKILNTVKAWAKVNNLKKIQYWYDEPNRLAVFSWYPIYLEIQTDRLGIEERKDQEIRAFYTIEELCGAEE